MAIPQGTDNDNPYYSHSSQSRVVGGNPLHHYLLLNGDQPRETNVYHVRLTWLDIGKKEKSTTHCHDKAGAASSLSLAPVAQR